MNIILTWRMQWGSKNENQNNNNKKKSAKHFLNLCSMILQMRCAHAKEVQTGRQAVILAYQLRRDVKETIERG